MGITSPLFPDENTISGADPAVYDEVADPEDDGEDIKGFANFMRSTKAPSRGELTAQVQAGAAIFKTVGCSVCHVDSITTAPAGAQINGHRHRRWHPDSADRRVRSDRESDPYRPLLALRTRNRL